MRPTWSLGCLLLLLARGAEAIVPAFPGVTTKTYNFINNAVPIVDNVDLVLLVNADDLPGQVVDAEVTLDIAHANSQDLQLYLTSPSFRTVYLSTSNGGGNDNVYRFTFDDQAPAATGTPPTSLRNLRNVTFGNVLLTDPPLPAIQSEEPLGAFAGDPSGGPWVLVIRDPTNGGAPQQLRAASLTLSALPAGGLSLGAPVTIDAPVPAAGTPIPDNNATGISSTIDVGGLGIRLYDVDVTVDVTHNNSGDLEFFLTSPSGQRIDLVNRVAGAGIGGGNDNLYAGTTFDDQAGGLPITDTALPPNGTAFGRIPGVGALSAFTAENPNGQWTLKVADRAGGTTGRLMGWSLTLITTGVCGDGVPDAGEVCDDSNLVDADGCDTNCTPTACGNGVKTTGEDCDDGNTADGDNCPAGCAFSETVCDDCVDNDRNGRTDVTDPACAPVGFTLTRGSVSSSRVTLSGTLELAANPSGAVGLALADGNGTLACVPLGTLSGRGKRYTARGSAAGPVSVTFTTRKRGTVAIKARGLDVSGFDDPNLTVGLSIGNQHFAGSGIFRNAGNKKKLP
jgi:cysteine-rich repeat protein